MKPIENLQVGDYVLVNGMTKRNSMKILQLKKYLGTKHTGSDEYSVYGCRYSYWNDGNNGHNSIRRKIIMKDPK